jgi:hypothetical protein
MDSAVSCASASGSNHRILGYSCKPVTSRRFKLTRRYSRLLHGIDTQVKANPKTQAFASLHQVSCHPSSVLRRHYVRFTRPLPLPLLSESKLGVSSLIRVFQFRERGFSVFVPMVDRRRADCSDRARFCRSGLGRPVLAPRMLGILTSKNRASSRSLNVGTNLNK